MTVTLYDSNFNFFGTPLKETIPFLTRTRMAGNENEALTSDPERQATQKPQLSRAKRFNRFLYNEEDKKICGRTWQSWRECFLCFCSAINLSSASYSSDLVSLLWWRKLLKVILNRQIVVLILLNKDKFCNVRF